MNLKSLLTSAALLAACTAPAWAGGELQGNTVYKGTQDFSGISNKSTVLSDLGASNATNLVTGTLNDARLSSNVLLANGSYSNPSWLNITFGFLGSKPTTLSGYGITDAQPLNATLTTLSGKSTTGTGNIVLSASPTFTGTASFGTASIGTASTATITNSTSATFSGTFQLSPGTAPGSPGEGWLYFDSSTHRLISRTNSAWATLLTDQDTDLPAIGGVNLTTLNAGNLSTGTVPNGRFPSTLPALSGVNLTALNATNLGSGTVPSARLAANLAALADDTSSTLDLSSVSPKFFALPFPGSNSIGIGNSGHTFSHADAVETGFESNELVITNSTANQNTLAVRNTHSGGYSAYTARDENGRETLAIGAGGSATIPDIFASTNYIQSWSGYLTSPGAPHRFRLTADGSYGALGSGFRFYQRFSIEPDGTPVFWRLIPWVHGDGGASQRRAMDLTETTVSGTMSGAKTFRSVILGLQSDGNSVDTQPGGYQCELRAGSDANCAIVLKSVEDSIDNGAANAIDLHVYGGTLAQHGGLRVYTGGVRGSQPLEFQVANDRTAVNNVLSLTPQAAPGSPAEGDVWYDSSAHRVKFQDNSATRTVIGAATTDTLTNKSIAASEINSGSLAVANGGTGDANGTNIVYQKIVPLSSTITSSSGTMADATGLSITYTPKSPGDTFIVEAVVCVGLPASGTAAIFQLMRDSTAIGVGDAAGSRNQVSAEAYPLNSATSLMSVPMGGPDAPGDTSSHTWKVQWACVVGTGPIYLNRSVTDTNSNTFQRGYSYIKLTELRP